jgi:hypothetical protein
MNTKPDRALDGPVIVTLVNLERRSRRIVRDHWSGRPRRNLVRRHSIKGLWCRPV